MLGIDSAAAQVQRRAFDAADAQAIERCAGAHDIRDRIHRAHLVEMHALHGYAVHRGFDFAQALEKATAK